MGWDAPSSRSGRRRRLWNVWASEFGKAENLPPWRWIQNQRGLSPAARKRLWRGALWDSVALRGRPSVERESAISRLDEGNVSTILSVSSFDACRRFYRETRLGSFTRHGYNDLRERFGPSCRLLTSGRSIRKPLMCCFKRKLATGATNSIGTIAPRLI